MNFRKHNNGKTHPVTPKSGVTKQTFDGMKGKRWPRIITREQKARMRTLENPLLYKNFVDKIKSLNPDFDVQLIDRTLEPEEALFDLKRKNPELNIGLNDESQGAEFRDWLDSLGITDQKVQNLVAMQDNPLNEVELNQLVYVLTMRSSHAEAVDKAFKAPVTRDLRRWTANSNRYDLPGMKI